MITPNIVDHKSGCTSFNESILTRIINATTLDAQINLTASIVADILPEFSISKPDEVGEAYTITIHSGHSFNQSITTRIGTPDDTLREIYTNLANHYDRSVNEGGYRKFLEAVNEISVAKEEACRNASGIISMPLQLLIQEFVTSYKMKDESAHSIRSIYGKLLCLNNTIDSDSSNSSRRRRDSDSDICECPPDGFDSDFTFCDFCDFYACFTDDVIEDIFFGPQYLIDFQCLAFVIDTTGSMSTEINTAKDIILNFVQSEQDIGRDGCYLMVEFNDVGPNHEIVPEDSKLM